MRSRIVLYWIVDLQGRYKYLGTGAAASTLLLSNDHTSIDTRRVCFITFPTFGRFLTNDCSDAAPALIRIHEAINYVAGG